MPLGLRCNTTLAALIKLQLLPRVTFAPLLLLLFLLFPFLLLFSFSSVKVRLPTHPLHGQKILLASHLVESWKWKLKLKVGSESWKLELNVKSESEKWKQIEKVRSEHGKWKWTVGSESWKVLASSYLHQNQLLQRLWLVSCNLREN